MEHAPIYRSTARRSGASLIPWKRTASLACAAVGVTISGITLGYHGLTVSAMSASTPSADATSTPRSGVPAVPTFTVEVAGGGHPDAISALSSALIARFPVAQAVVATLAAPLGPFGPRPEPQPPAAFEPTRSIDLSITIGAPLDLAAEDTLVETDLEMADVSPGPVVGAWIPEFVTLAAPEEQNEAAAQASAAVEPEEQAAAPEPAAASAPTEAPRPRPIPAAQPAPAPRVALPTVSARVKVKPIVVEDEPQLQNEVEAVAEEPQPVAEQPQVSARPARAAPPVNAKRDGEESEASQGEEAKHPDQGGNKHANANKERRGGGSDKGDKGKSDHDDD